MTKEAIKAAKQQSRAELSDIATEADRELLIRYHALEGELKRRRTNERIRYYTPHLKQQNFHAAGAKYRLRFIFGGNRSGKTECSMGEAVAHALGYRPWLPKDHPDYVVMHAIAKKPIQVPNRGLIVAESFGEQIKKVILHKLLGNPTSKEGGLIPTPEIRSVKRNQQGVITEIHFQNGSAMYFKSYEQAVKLFESENYDWYALDEPPPREHYIAISRGCTDTGAPIWCAMTPLTQAWIHDELVPREDVFKIHFDITDNIGFGLTAEAVAEFEKDLSEDEKEMRLRGKFFHLGGLIYKEFSRETHLIKRPDKRWPVGGSWRYFMHVDVHKRKRHKAVYMALRPDGVYLVIGQQQTPPDNNRISAFADQLLSYERHELQLSRDELEGHRLIDPLAKEPVSTGDGVSVLAEFESKGIYFSDGSKKRDTAIHYMRELLRHRPSEGVYPLLYVVEDCDQVIFEFEHYQWEEWKGANVADRKDPNPDPRKKNDDYIEGIHRIVLETYEPPSNESESDYYGYQTKNRIEGFSTGY